MLAICGLAASACPIDRWGSSAFGPALRSVAGSRKQRPQRHLRVQSTSVQARRQGSVDRRKSRTGARINTRAELPVMARR